MAQNGYGPGGHIGRIPNYGKTQVNPMGNVEPPACIQNAMMTKDKKPFTYTPGGLDLSQIRTPSMARRMARQKSLEDHEQAYYQPQQANNGGYQQPQANYGGYHPQGGPVPPPPPPPKAPVPPPPPPIVIEVPNSKSPKPVALGERPEIVIPENPIGMLRKTNSPYHWEAEQADQQRIGTVPKFVEKVPSPLTVKMPPSSFSQQQPQSYTPQGQNNFQRGPYGQPQPESPVHRPEAQYANQKSFSPGASGSPPTRELLQRQDSQFNKSPQPFSGQSPLNSSSPYSPSPNNNWRQPEKRDSPAHNIVNNNSQQSPPQLNRGQFSPNTQQFSPNVQNQSPPANSSPVFHTLPRVGQRNQEAVNNNTIYNNTNEPKQISPQTDNSAPWRTSTLNRHSKEPEPPQSIYHNMQKINQQPTYVPPWKANEANNNTSNENSYIPPWKQENKPQQQQQTASQRPVQDSNNNKVQDTYTPQWRSQDNANRSQNSPPTKPNQEPPRYQTTMSIPVTPKRQPPQPEYNPAPQREAVYVNQEPVYYCPESPQTIPPWVKTQKEKTKTPPPAWVQKPLEGRRSSPRELTTPPREFNQDPEWVRKSNEMQQNVRDVISPPKYQQPVQPTWSTRPSENRKSLPRDQAPNTQGNRVIPIQMEVSSDMRDQGRQGNQQPQLRIVIGMNENPSGQGRAEVPFSPPTQRIMRVLSPQLVRMDESPAQPELPTLNRSFQNTQDNQPKTRIIPIQIEGGGNGGGNKSVYYHKFTQEGPPRQSKAFKVLQIITGTQDEDPIQDMENLNGFTDL